MYYSDNPISNLNDDSLGRSSFSKLLANALFNLKTEDTFTVGLYGKWGSGKTSIVNMALKELEKLELKETNRTIVVHFEPWQFSDSQQLLNQFIIRLANEFSTKKDKSLNKIGKALQSYSDAFSFAELIPVAGGAISSVGKIFSFHIGSKIQNDISKKDVLEQKKQVIKLLEERETKILVVIDDIDRLSNDQIRQIFQLVSSVAKFPNTAYLLVFDKEIVVKALEKVQEGHGEDYLEKIIQIPIQIPDIKEAQLHKSLFLHLDEIIKEYNVPFHSERWNKLFIPCVAPFITTIRDINRLLNSLQFKLTTIHSEIEFSDMVSICAIEIGVPKIYEWIKKHKNILVGDYDYSQIGTSRMNSLDWLKKYTDELTPFIEEYDIQIKGYSKTKIETIINCLSSLFPPFAYKIGKSYSTENDSVARKYSLIYVSDKFDRYFTLDIDDVFITNALLNKIVFSYSVKELEDYLLKINSEGKAYEFLQELKALLPDISRERLSSLFLAIANVLVYFDSKDSNGILGASTYTLAQYYAFDIINSVPQDERYSFFIDALNNSSNNAIEAFAQLINMVELAYGRLEANGTERTSIEKSFSISELESIEKAFVLRCKNILKSSSIFDLPHWRMTLFLIKSFDNEFVSNYMASEMKLDKNVVSYLPNIITSWIGTGISYEVQSPPYDYVTTDRIIDAINNLIDSQELYNLENEIQHRAAAFYLNHIGKTSYDNHISEKDTISFLESKKTISDN